VSVLSTLATWAYARRSRGPEQRTLQRESTSASRTGRFTLDTAFNGVKNTRPSGVIHIVAGGGGANLYGPGLEKTKETLQKQFGGNYEDFTAKMVADQHSFTVLENALRVV
jgi:hypothetical protein